MVPIFAAIRRAKYPTLIVGSIGMTQRRHIDQIGIGGMNTYAGDMTCVLQTQVRPGFPCIGRLIDTIAVGDVAPDAAFSHPDVDDVGVGVGDSDSADSGS